MPSVWKARCPAKLNLFLSVGPKDQKGWHPLRSTFQAIDIFDTLIVEISNQDSISTNVDYLPEDNSLSRALTFYRLLAETPPLKMRLEKAIPPQSGLGGGSSDAAGLLRILQHLTDNPVPPAALKEIAAKVGADVPFFLVGGLARAEGYGETLTSLEDPPRTHFVVVKPEVDCPTPAMFRALDDLEYEWRDFPESNEIYNDFSRVMPEGCHKHIRCLLSAAASSAGLSGSGSAVFGTFPSHTSALTAAQLVRNEGEENVWVCQSLSRQESLMIHKTYW